MATMSEEHRIQHEEFNDWLRKMDNVLIDRIGLTHRDLKDMCYADWFVDGIDHFEAADMVLDAIGFEQED